MVYRHSTDWFLTKGLPMTHKPEPDCRAAAMLAYGALLARNSKGEFQPVLDAMREILFPTVMEGTI